MSPVAGEMRAQRIVSLLSKATGISTLHSSLAWLQTGDCEGSLHHSPSPLLIRPYYLSAAVQEVLGDEPSTEDELIYLCSTCRDNLTVYLSVLYAYNGAPPMAVKRDFGNIIRHLGDRAWLHWIEADAHEDVLSE